MIRLSEIAFYRRFIKRPMDIILSLLALLILSPVFLMVAFLVRLKLGSPVFFKQKRPGLNGRIFMMYKFRTMTDKKDENGDLYPDSIRLTKFGKILRSTSLDELPEIINILKGDMSIVGPRPQLVRDMVFMNSEQRRRHSVLPGLTGWAQINGRNGVSWEKKLELDLEYIENFSFLGDLKIILTTVFKVFKRDNISSEGMDTAEDFGDYLLKERKISHDFYHEALEESKRLLNGRRTYL
jgi:undecaprenyl phosphate N,N'-diacetylbacillosamine 1-phosphate transferase